MNKIYAFILAVLLVGCSSVETRALKVVSSDLDVAIPRGEAALGSKDALVVCYKALDEVVKAQSQADQLDDGKLLDAVMRARIMDKVREKVGKQLQASCSEIAMEVLIQAASRGRK